MSTNKFNNFKYIHITLLMGVIICLYSCSTNKKDGQNDWESYNLKGKVLFLKERHYNAKLEFGNVVRETDSLFTGSNSSGLFPIIIGPTNELEDNQDVTFEKSGSIYRKIVWNNKGIASFDGYKYDDKKRLFIHRKSDHNIRIDSNETIWSSYDIDSFSYKDGQSYKYYKDKERLKYHLATVTKYNDANKPIEEIEYSPDGSMERRRVYQYDEQGRLVSDILYDRDQELYNIIIQYQGSQKIYAYNSGSTVYEIYGDSSYNQLREKGTLDNQTQEYRATRFKYDSLGNVILKSHQGNDAVSDIQTTYKYEYDEKGNWITRVQYNSSNPTMPERLTERTIEYYYSYETFGRVILAFLAHLGLCYGFVYLFGLFLFLLIRYPLSRLISLDKDSYSLRRLVYIISAMFWVLFGVYQSYVYINLNENLSHWIVSLIILLPLFLATIICYSLHEELHQKIFSDNTIFSNKLFVKRNSSALSKHSLIVMHGLKYFSVSAIVALLCLISNYTTGINPTLFIAPFAPNILGIGNIEIGKLAMVFFAGTMIFFLFDRFLFINIRK